MKIAMIILLSFLYVLVEFYLIRAMRNGFHILQLENYHRDRYGKWIKENKAKSYPFFRMLIALLPIFFIWNELALIISSIVCLLLNIIGTKKKKEKKEFVLTNRMIREFIIASIVWLIDAVASVTTYILIKPDFVVIYIGTLVVALILSFIGLLIGFSWFSFVIAIILSAGFFGAAMDNEANAIVFGLIVGLILGLLETPLVEFTYGAFVAGFYEGFFGGHLLLIVILGVIMAYVSNMYLKESIRGATDNFKGML